MYVYVHEHTAHQLLLLLWASGEATQCTPIFIDTVILWTQALQSYYLCSVLRTSAWGTGRWTGCTCSWGQTDHPLHTHRSGLQSQSRGGMEPRKSFHLECHQHRGTFCYTCPICGEHAQQKTSLCSQSDWSHWQHSGWDLVQCGRQQSHCTPQPPHSHSRTDLHTQRGIQQWVRAFSLAHVHSLLHCHMHWQTRSMISAAHTNKSMRSIPQTGPFRDFKRHHRRSWPTNHHHHYNILAVWDSNTNFALAAVTHIYTILLVRWYHLTVDSHLTLCKVHSNLLAPPTIVLSKDAYLADTRALRGCWWVEGIHRDTGVWDEVEGLVALSLDLVAKGYSLGQSNLFTCHWDSVLRSCGDIVAFGVLIQLEELQRHKLSLIMLVAQLGYSMYLCKHYPI